MSHFFRQIPILVSLLRKVLLESFAGISCIFFWCVGCYQKGIQFFRMYHFYPAFTWLYYPVLILLSLSICKCDFCSKSLSLAGLSVLLCPHGMEYMLWFHLTTEVYSPHSFFLCDQWIQARCVEQQKYEAHPSLRASQVLHKQYVVGLGTRIHGHSVVAGVYTRMSIAVRGYPHAHTHICN